MNVRCSYCRHSFNLSKEYMVQAVAEATEKHQKYHSLECINCRKHIKVPIAQMKHYLPAPASDESAS
jgi:nitrate/TMAO reductase-like tetraheme cytochrome c subunit